MLTHWEDSDRSSRKASRLYIYQTQSVVKETTIACGLGITCLTTQRHWIGKHLSTTDLFTLLLLFFPFTFIGHPYSSARMHL